VVRITTVGGELTFNASGDLPVLLRCPEELPPIDYDPEVDVPRGLHLFQELLVKNLATDESNRLLIASYFLAVFLKDITPDRPILKFSGITASGKTTAADLFAHLLLGQSGLEVSTLAARFTESPIAPVIILDNLESQDIGQGDLHFLLTSATGITKKKRAFGTDSGIVREKAEALVVVTAIEPFAKPELINRTLEVEFRMEAKRPGFTRSEAHREIAKHRNTILSTVFQTFSRKVLPALAEGRHTEVKRFLDLELPNHSKERCNEFLAIMAVIVEALQPHVKGASIAEQILPKWTAYQDQVARGQERSASEVLFYLEGLMQTLQGDPDPAFDIDLEETKEGGLTFETSSARLLAAFLRLAREWGTRCPFKNAGQLMARLVNDLPVLKERGWEYEPEVRKIRGERFHRFSRAPESEGRGEGQ
jgi:hypothetical protein